MINNDEALWIAEKLGVNFDKFSFQDWVIGLNIELEHGKVNPTTNVTDDELEKTAKIALAHLNEFPDYYNPNYGLPAWEEFMKFKSMSRF